MRNKGFTLIEILVVIAIIAGLLAISIPVLQKSKKQARKIVCTNNLHQINLSLSVYQQENKSYPPGFHSLPSFSNETGNSSDDWQNGRWWFHFLENDIQNSNCANYKTFWCPSRRLPESPISKYILCGNYGINYSICKITKPSTDEFEGRPLKLEQIHSPFSKLLLMDSGYTLISWKALAPESLYSFERLERQGSYYLPGAELNENRTINQIQQNDAVGGRHYSQKFNAVFVDGHVDSKNPSSVAPEFDAAGNISNSSFWSP